MENHYIRDLLFNCNYVDHVKRIQKRLNENDITKEEKSILTLDYHFSKGELNQFYSKLKKAKSSFPESKYLRTLMFKADMLTKQRNISRTKYFKETKHDESIESKYLLYQYYISENNTKKSEEYRILLNGTYIENEKYFKFQELYKENQNEKKYETNLDFFRKELSKDKSNGYVWLCIFRSLYSLAEYEELIDKLNSNSRITSEYIKQRFLQESYFKLENFEESINSSEKLLSVFSKHSRSLYLMTKSYIGMDNLELAEKYGKQLYELKPDRDSLTEYIFTVHNQRKYKESLKLSQELIKMNENDAHSNYICSKTFAVNKKVKESISFAKKAVEISPKVKMYSRNVATIYKLAGLNDDYIKSLVTNYNDFNDKSTLLEIISYYDQNDEAITICKYYDILLEDFPNDIDGYSQYAEYCMENGNLDKAIDILKSIPSERTDKNSLFNLGKLLLEKEDYEEAIKYFDEAFQIEQSAKNGYFLALSLYESSNYDEAIKRLDSTSKLSSNPYWTKELQKLRKLVEYDSIHKKRDKRLDEILTESSQILEFTKDQKDTFGVFMKNKETQAEYNYLQVLRRWNSFTPIITSMNADSVGGGYFLKVGTKGIVIDPGFNFIENFMLEGHIFNEITTIFISHAHNDHTADLESILSLLHIYNKNLEQTVEKGFEYEKPINTEDVLDTLEIDYKHTKDEMDEISLKGIDRINESYKTIIPQDNEKRSNQIEPKVLDIYISKSVFQKYIGMLNLKAEENYKVHIIEGNQVIDLSDSLNSFKISTFDCKHDDVISDYSSHGFIFKIGTKYLLYTGDTGVSEQLIQNITEGLSKLSYKKNQQIVMITHLGGFKDIENDYSLHEYTNVYKNHLGRVGIFSLANAFTPYLCVISEFGEEFKGFRSKITEIFDSKFDKTKFVSADIGLTIYINKVLKISGITAVSRDNDKVLQLEIGKIDIPELREITVNDDIFYFKESEKLDGDIYRKTIRETILQKEKIGRFFKYTKNCLKTSKDTSII